MESSSDVKYREDTRKDVEKYLKKAKQSYQKDIIRLGTDVQKIDWYTAKAILSDLEREGKVKSSTIGKMLVYEWVEAVADV